MKNEICVEMSDSNYELMQERLERSRRDRLTDRLRMIMYDLLFGQVLSGQIKLEDPLLSVTHEEIMLGVLEHHIDTLVFQYHLTQSHKVLASTVLGFPISRFVHDHA